MRKAAKKALLALAAAAELHFGGAGILQKHHQSLSSSLCVHLLHLLLHLCTLVFSNAVTLTVSTYRGVLSCEPRIF